MAKAKTSKKSKTSGEILVTFLLDKSSSMGLIYDQTISGFNEYLDTLKADPDGVKLTLLQFDTGGIEKTYLETPVKDAPALSKENYRPTGGTPLIDAAYKTIKAVEVAVAKKDAQPKIVICVQTDGEENASRDHTWEDLKTLIEQKTKEGWQFNFMGTGIDAYAQGVRMGFSQAQTVSTGMTAPEIRASYAATAASTMRFGRGLSNSTAYLSAEKVASGDKFDVIPKLDLSTQAPKTSTKVKVESFKDFSL